MSKGVGGKKECKAGKNGTGGAKMSRLLPAGKAASVEGKVGKSASREGIR